MSVWRPRSEKPASERQKSVIASYLILNIFQNRRTNASSQVFLLHEWLNTTGFITKLEHVSNLLVECIKYTALAINPVIRLCGNSIFYFMNRKQFSGRFAPTRQHLTQLCPGILKSHASPVTNVNWAVFTVAWRSNIHTLIFCPHRTDVVCFQLMNLSYAAPNPVQMGCLNISLENVKIDHRVTLHLSLSALWQPAEREQTPLFLRNTRDIARVLTSREIWVFLRDKGKKFLIFQAPVLSVCHSCTQRHANLPLPVQQKQHFLHH